MRWLTGHTFLKLQNFRCGIETTSVCRLCGLVPERADHILLECPKLNVLRAECFRTWDTGPNPHWEVDWILKFLEDGVVEHLEESELAEDGAEANGDEEDHGDQSPT